MPLFTKRRSIFLTLGILCVILGLILLYSNRGFLHLKRLDQERNYLEAVNKDLEAQNRQLMMKIDRIKHDLRYIEDVARKKLGLIRPDEQIFRLKDDPGSDPDEKRSSNP